MLIFYLQKDGTVHYNKDVPVKGQMQEPYPQAQDQDLSEPVFHSDIDSFYDNFLSLTELTENSNFIHFKSTCLIDSDTNYPLHFNLFSGYNLYFKRYKKMVYL